MKRLEECEAGQLIAFGQQMTQNRPSPDVFLLHERNRFASTSRTRRRFSASSWLGPQETLFDDDGKQLTTHYSSPNPVEGGVLRATWQHSRNTSTVSALAAQGDSSTDPDFVAPGAIAWLKLTVVGSREGSGGGDTLARTRFIQRLNTSGGVAPAAGCASLTDVGKQAFVPYTADYVFYTDR